MWIALRLLFAAGAFAVRLHEKLWRPKSAGGEFEGRRYYRNVHTHRGRITKVDLGIETRCPVVMAFVREGAADRLSKWLDISRECQTGDPAFDETVYIVCDHPAVEQALQSDPQLRSSVAGLLRQGERLWTDGEAVWVRCPGSPDTEPILALLDYVSKRLDGVSGLRAAAFADPFARRAVALEAFGWALAGYAVAAAAGMPGTDVHLFAADLIRPGLAASAMLLILLLLAAMFLFRGSSRAHRFFVESALLLLLAVPAAGLQAYADLNRALDASPAVEAVAEILHRERRVHHGRRGRRSYSYHLTLRPVQGPPGLRLPSTIKVDRSIYASSGRYLRMGIGLGAFGHPWFRRWVVE